MWRLGIPLVDVTISTATGHAQDVSVCGGWAVQLARRARDEEAATFLLAADAVNTLLRTGPINGATSENHSLVHRLMVQYDTRSAVQVAWCEYLWHRAYALVADPMNWALIMALAELLERYETVPGVVVERYLGRAAESVAAGLTFTGYGEVAPICSPFHRDTYKGALRAGLPMMQTEVPEILAGVAAETGLIPIADVLPGLSSRARRCLDKADIRFAADLEDWDVRSLGTIKHLGKKTLAEILAAVRDAGLRIASDDWNYPWRRNPRRWS